MNQSPCDKKRHTAWYTRSILRQEGGKQGGAARLLLIKCNLSVDVHL